MAREEREIHNLEENGPPGEEAAAGSSGAEDNGENLENHLGYHNFYGY